MLDLEKFREGDREEFLIVCNNYEKQSLDLCATYISDREMQENVVAEVFRRLFHARSKISSLQDISIFLAVRIKQLAEQPNLLAPNLNGSKHPSPKGSNAKSTNHGPN